MSQWQIPIRLTRSARQGYSFREVGLVFSTTHPVDVAVSLGVPVLGLYGGADQGIPVSTVETMRAALNEAKKPSEIVVFPETPHGFYADCRDTYRKQQADDAWNKMLDWLKKNGV